MSRVSVITFPGSNCNQDAQHVSRIRGHIVHDIWHKDTDLQNPDLVIVPGGFSYGDYLRCGAIAKFSPIIQSVIQYAQKGGLVIGICNGFQILTECGLLPGALMMNEQLSFICQHQWIRVDNNETPFTTGLARGTVLDVPIAHKEGNYFIEEDGLKQLLDNQQVVFRYSAANGEITANSNPNGSIDSIAGICNERRNVLGMMPHPERAAEEGVVVSHDGARIFEAIERYWESLS